MEIKIIYTSGIKEIYREKSSESRNYQYDNRDDMTLQRNTKNDERKYKTNQGVIRNERRHDSSKYDYSKKQKIMKENTKQIKEWKKEDMIQANMTIQRNKRMMKENTKQIKEWWETKEDMIQRNMTCGKN